MIFFLKVVRLFFVDVFGHPNEGALLRIDWKEKQVWLEKEE
jgi:hypothetical protein